MFTYYFGDADLAAVFILDPSNFASGSHPIPPPLTVRYSELRWLMDHDLLKPEALRQAIFDIEAPVVNILFRVALAARLYDGLEADGATVSSRVLSSPFTPQATEIPYEVFEGPRDNLNPHGMYNIKWQRMGSLDVALSLIAYLETGRDLLGHHGQKCETLLGVCIGDSIYVPRNV